jgi:hypothetical protein
MNHIEIEDQRSALPWPYIAILIGEIVVLGRLVASSHGRPPMTYEIGWAGCGSMLVMQVYSIRRRVRALGTFGSLHAWLDLHVFLGLQGFVLVAYHSVGISPHASLAAINFSLVAIVVGTGVVGRYLYHLIPRARARARAARGSTAIAARVAALELAERWLSRWTLLHRPVAFLLLAITTLHVLAHFAYAV